RQLVADFAPKVLGPISPDDTQVAYLGVDGPLASIFVLPLEGGRPRRLITDALDSQRLAWSPDGKRLAFVKGNAIAVLSTVDGAERELPVKDVLYSELSWEPAESIRYLSAFGSSMLDPDSGATRPLRSWASGASEAFVWSPTADRFATA